MQAKLLAETAVAGLELAQQERQTLERLLDIALNVPLDELVDAVESTGRPEPDMLKTSTPFNLIPSTERGGCHPVLFAVVRKGGRQGSKGFEPTLDAVLRHLEVCKGMTRVVVIVSPATWKWPEFARSFGPRLAEYAGSVRFIVVVHGPAPFGASPLLLRF